MIHEASTPQEYVKILEDDWRKEKLLFLRELIKQAAPDIKEGMEYRMLAYGNKQGNVMHLNAQKNFVSLYVGNIKKIDPNDELLKGVDTGKGCIRIKKTTNIESPNIIKFIEQTIALWRENKDLAC